MNNLNINFCGVNFQNPVVLASGVLGVSAEGMADVIQNGAGGITTKSIWKEPHQGHKNPVIIASGDTVLNAVGLSDGGLEKACEEIARYKKLSSAPIIANIVAGKVHEFGEIAQRISELDIDLIEVNISCPNVEDQFGTPFACDVSQAAEVARIVRKNTKKKFSVKLSPNVPNIGAIARSVENAGADAITAINTVGPGMRIDIDMRKPILANKVGGLSGPAIFPVAVRCVRDVHNAVKIPIIGTGGVSTGREAIEIMMAGATLVGVGSAVLYGGIEVFGKIVREMEEWCEAEGVEDLRDIVGVGA